MFCLLCVILLRRKASLCERETLRTRRENKVYYFTFEPEALGELVEKLEPTFATLRLELLEFAGFLERAAKKE